MSENVATFHYTEVVNGVKNEHHLCSSCAANTDVSYYSSILRMICIYQALSGLLGAQGFLSDNGNDDPAVNVVCPKCGMTYGEFIASSRFGCSECYDVSDRLLRVQLRRYRAATVIPVRSRCYIRCRSRNRYSRKEPLE